MIMTMFKQIREHTSMLHEYKRKMSDIKDLIQDTEK